MLSEILVVIATALTNPTPFAGGLTVEYDTFTGDNAPAVGVSMYYAHTDTCKVFKNTKYSEAFAAEPEIEATVVNHEIAHCYIERATGAKYRNTVFSEQAADLYALYKVKLSYNVFNRLKKMRIASELRDPVHATACVWKNWTRETKLEEMQVCFEEAK